MSAGERREAARAAVLRRARGFTLVEVLAVILLISLVLGVALDFYVDLSNAGARAAEGTRTLRRAAALLDRVAGDFERTILVRKPEETDPLAHPWIFLGERYRSELGADRIKFVTRRAHSRRSEGPASDLEMVAYELLRSEDGDDFELHRWSRAGLPESLEREFPPADDPAALLLADEISGFGVRFLSADGSWTEAWDSSQLLQSGELPVAVEIRVAVQSASAPPGDDALPRILARRVRLPMPALDLEELFEPEGEGDAAGEDDDEEDGELTLADCIDFDVLSASAGDAMSRLSADVVAELERLRANAAEEPFAPYRAYLADHPSVRAQCR